MIYFQAYKTLELQRKTNLKLNYRPNIILPVSLNPRDSLAPVKGKGNLTFNLLCVVCKHIFYPARELSVGLERVMASANHEQTQQYNFVGKFEVEGEKISKF